MPYEGSVKFTFTCKDIAPGYGSSFPEMVPNQNVTVESPCFDLNIHQYFELFKSFIRAVGFNDYTIMDGACRLAFSDGNSESDIKKLMEEYDLQDKQYYTDDARALEDEVRDLKLKAEIRDLKAKLSRALNPTAEQYTEEEMDALCAENQVTADTLKNAQVVCHDCGDKYGTYSVGSSSTWTGKCGVCGKTKGVTEVRDYGYLTKGIEELTK
jgi:hypothetical protein